MSDTIFDSTTPSAPVLRPEFISEAAYKVLQLDIFRDPRIIAYIG